MVSQAEGAVVVALDGSAKDDLAIDWAADQAARVQRDLHILHCLPVAVRELTVMGESRVEALTSSTVDQARARAVARQPGVTVTTQVLVEDPVSALVRISKSARGIVLGASGKKRLGGLLGSVSQKVAAHSEGPIAVVRSDAAAPDGPVVVGVDPVDPVPEVLEWAFFNAHLRNVGVRLVHAPSRAGRAAAGSQEDRAEITRAAQEWSDRFPDVSFEVVESSEHPIEALLDEASRGCVVVVGSRGRWGFAGTRLGSVARGVLQGGAPVVVVVRVRAAG